MTDVARLGVAGERIATAVEQIALAHTQGNGREVSCRNVADSVSGLLGGVKVTHYLSVTMDAVPIYNDLLGGVELEVLEDFTGIDDTLVRGERVTLIGEHALNYVRTRYGLEDSTNSTRMQRQQQYLNALREKTEKIMEQDGEFIVRASLEMSEHIVSDRSVTQLQELAKKMTEYEFTDIYSIEGDNVEGEKFIEFYPDADSLRKTVIDLFYVPKD
jgi:anionic cell wall polymer biosynthesis LytR-Cps2A-Psr (LCP) family protein